MQASETASDVEPDVTDPETVPAWNAIVPTAKSVAARFACADGFFQQATPGRFQKIQNWIGQPGSTLATASFIPPPSDDVETCLVAWEKFLHESDLPLLVTIALAHYRRQKSI